MKQRSKVAIVFIAVLLLPVGFTMHVVAQEVREAPLNSPAPAPAPAPDRDRGEFRTMNVEDTLVNEEQATREEKLRERLEERKLKRAVQLDAAEKQRLEANCSAAQGKIRALEGKVQGIETSRQQVYTNLLGKLTALNTELQPTELDTTALDAQLTKLESEIDDFYKRVAEYKQAVADMGAMDCQADVEAFKATLEAARELQTSLRQSAKDIRGLFTDTITSTLANLRQQSATTQTTEGNED